MGFIFGDGFDFVHDEILAWGLKRRRVDTDISNYSLKRTLEDQQLGDRNSDEEYWMFLNHLGDYFESRASKREDGDDSGEEDDVEPQYKIFLENLREDGKSYVFKFAKKCEVPLTIKYEEEEHEKCTVRKSRKVVDAERMGAAKGLRNDPIKDKMETRKNLRNTVRKVMMDSMKNTRNRISRGKRNSVVEKDLRSERVNHDSSEENRLSSRKPSRKDDHSVEIRSEHEMVVDMVDECYQTYLSWIKEEDDCINLAIEHGKPVQDGGIDGETSSDSVVVVACNASDLDEGNYNPFESSKLFFSLMEEDEQEYLLNPATSNHSGFREKLMDKLKEPYDHKEYEELWHDINEQRLKERHLELRAGVTKSCKKFNELGPSYLERHIVLKEKIDAVLSDRPKVLNLLRGFFFWLQNLVQQDAFPPWLDPFCMEVMPRNSPEDYASAAKPSDYSRKVGSQNFVKRLSL